MYQSWNPSGSWGDQTPVSLNWTPQCPKAEAPVGPQWPDSHIPQLNPIKSQSWSTSSSWGDQTPTQPEPTPQCPKAKTPVGPEETHLLSAWSEPHNVPKPKPEQVLRPDSQSSWTESHNVPNLKSQWVLRRHALRAANPRGVGRGLNLTPHPPSAYWPDCLSRKADWSLVPDRVQAGCWPFTSPQRGRTGSLRATSAPLAGLGSIAGQRGDWRERTLHNPHKPLAWRLQIPGWEAPNPVSFEEPES